MASMDPALLESLTQLPGSVPLFFEAVRGITEWAEALDRGYLPESTITWPEEPLRSAWLETLGELEMGRFCARHPKLVPVLIKNLVAVLQAYREKHPPEEQAGPGAPGDGDPQNPSSPSSDDGDPSGMDNADAVAAAAKEAAEEEAAAAADVAKLMRDMKQEWSPALSAIDAADAAFGGAVDITDSAGGFDLTSAEWASSGWAELRRLTDRCGQLREVRDLVRKLGKGAGAGPLRRAPRRVPREGAPEAQVRSPRAPTETRGLSRSGDLDRMLPVEMALLGGNKTLHRLHMVRRVEKGLLSYDRVGWEDEPAVPARGLEMRPTAEKGPVLICLDTSGSMQGKREAVAKALVLATMRAAHAQMRRCYLYCFSGPGDVEEFELSLTRPALTSLVTFLANSFNGGTDINTPVERALKRLQEGEWAMADLLLVSDGEINAPAEAVMDAVERAKTEKQLKVFGLLLGGESPILEALCTKGELMTFKSWGLVNDERL